MNVLGLMSGSSLDGLDMALCQFELTNDGVVVHHLLETKQIEFSDALVEKLCEASEMTSRNLFLLEAEFSDFVGHECRYFIAESAHKVDLIASHGHTIFHYPEQKFTTQLGNGGLISQIAKCDVVCDFRSSDIGAGGLGAPCAPIADYYLFPDAKLFLNIGGISNISYKSSEGITAFDISPANQLLNHLAKREGFSFDRDGKMAALGKVDKTLLENLRSINDLKNAEPRALDNSWVQDNFIPILEGGSTQDLLRTCVEFIVLETVSAIELLSLSENVGGIVATGGGAFNKFLMDQLRAKIQVLDLEIIDLSPSLINYKEAMLIALMGFLRKNRIANVMKSVTGAFNDTIGGCLYVY